MITGKRITELFRNGMRRNIDEAQRAEWVEILSGYQQFKDYRLALDQLRTRFIGEFGLCSPMDDRRAYFEGLISFIDQILME